MSYDGRKKGCPNENCGKHKNKVKYKAEDRFCTECATELVFVCARCFKEIEDEGPEHKYCEECEAKRTEPTLFQNAKYVIKGLDLARADAVKKAKDTMANNDAIDTIIEVGSTTILNMGTFAFKKAEKIFKRER